MFVLPYSGWTISIGRSVDCEMPHPMQVRDVHVVTFINICTVFFISGLTLHTGELKQALTRRTVFGTVYGFIAILGGYNIAIWFSLHARSPHAKGSFLKRMGA